MQRPQLGDIVLYVGQKPKFAAREPFGAGDPRAYEEHSNEPTEYEADDPAPAIVTAVHENRMVNLRVLGDDEAVSAWETSVEHVSDVSDTSQGGYWREK